MPSVLMVAEKPSIAESVASALVGRSNYKYRAGKTPVYQLECAFQGRVCDVRVGLADWRYV